MEAGQSQQPKQSTRERLSGDLQKALEDLRKAGENATGDVRSGIESAVSRIRDASAATSTGDIRAQLESFRDWLQNTTADVLDEIEKEVRKRREQLRGEAGAGAGAGGQTGGDGGTGGTGTGTS